MDYNELNEIWDEEEYDSLTVDGDWFDDGKREFRTSVMKVGDSYYQVDECRSGSYYTDYYYDDPIFYEVEPYTETITITKWKVKK